MANIYLRLNMSKPTLICTYLPPDSQLPPTLPHHFPFSMVPLFTHVFRSQPYKSHSSSHKHTKIPLSSLDNFTSKIHFFQLFLVYEIIIFINYLPLMKVPLPESRKLFWATHSQQVKWCLAHRRHLIKFVE